MINKVKDDDKRLVIRIPFKIWKKVRRLEEQNKVNSIQDAVFKGLNLLISSDSHEDIDN